MAKPKGGTMNQKQRPADKPGKSSTKATSAAGKKTYGK